MAWTCLIQKVWYFMAYFRAPSKIWQSPTVARIYLRHLVMYTQDQVCDSNHGECVLFSQSLVPRRNTKAYFLHHNTGCYQLCNNPRFPILSQSMGVKVIRIDSVAQRLARELIADCLGPTFKTHVRSFINKGHVVKLPLNYQRSSFTWRNFRFVRVACMDVACEQVLPSWRVSQELECHRL